MPFRAFVLDVTEGATDPPVTELVLVRGLDLGGMRCYHAFGPPGELLPEVMEVRLEPRFADVEPRFADVAVRCETTASPLDGFRARYRHPVALMQGNN